MSLNIVRNDSRRGKEAVNWRQVGWFLGLTFGLTWLLDLVLYLAGGLSNPVTLSALQLQMLLPAFSAILLGTFFFNNSPLYFRTNQTASRWFTYYFMLLTAAYLGVVIYSLFNPAQVQMLSSWLLIPNVVGLLLVIVLRLVGKKNAFAGAGMAGGKARYWLLFGLGFVLLYAVQTLLNYLFKLGQPVNLLRQFPQLAAVSAPTWLLLLTAAANTILIGPFIGLLMGFGEEYGWRGYLQPELVTPAHAGGAWGLGRVRGVLLLGVIWGVWHWPVILMGYNYPGQPVLGMLLMVLYTIALAYILAYAVFKAQGVWIAAFLHALNNQTIGFFHAVIYTPTDPTFAFGIGLPGLIVFAVVVLLILRDPIWKEA